MNHYVYKVVNWECGYEYIGVRSCLCKPEEDVSYMGSGIAIRNVLKAHPKKEFYKYILEVCETREQASLVEESYVTEEYIEREGVLNLCTGGETRGASFPSSSTRKKMCVAAKERMANSETRKKVSDSAKAQFASPEAREKLSEQQKEVMARAGTRANLSIKSAELWRDQEYREKTMKAIQKAKNTSAYKAKMRKITLEHMKRPGRKEQMRKQAKDAWEEGKMQKAHVGMVTCYCLETKTRKKLPREEYFALRDQGKVLGINSNAYKEIRLIESDSP